MHTSDPYDWFSGPCHSFAAQLNKEKENPKLAQTVNPSCFSPVLGLLCCHRHWMLSARERNHEIIY